MKFAIINDTHLGPGESGFEKGVRRKLVNKAEPLLKSVIQTLNKIEQPEFVINLGDSIEDINDRQTDIGSFNRVLAIFSQLSMPVYHLIGNHDVRTLKEQEIAQMLGYQQMYYSFDHGQFHFIVLSFAITGDHTRVVKDITAIVPLEQTNWLKTDLSQTVKPTVVFIHYGLAEDDMKGNFWFANEPDYALISNRQEVRQILEKSGKVKAVFSAHQHWNRMHVHNKIPYFTVTSLIENFNNDGVPTKAYTIVNLDENKVSVSVKGNDPAEFEYKFI